jgi:hypothetical protein
LSLLKPSRWGALVPDVDKIVREIGDDYVERLMKEIREKDTEIREAFAVAFLAETGLKISDVELVSEFDSGSLRWRWWFRRRATHDGLRDGRCPTCRCSGEVHQ